MKSAKVQRRPTHIDPPGLNAYRSAPPQPTLALLPEELGLGPGQFDQQLKSLLRRGLVVVVQSLHHHPHHHCNLNSTLAILRTAFLPHCIGRNTDMVKEESPKTTRRTTRSSAAATSSKNVVEETYVSSHPSTEVEVRETKGKGSTRKFGDCEVDQLDFHMPTSAKYLLISAFLASRNPATLDASLFDSTGGSNSRKRRRKASEKSMEQKETAEQELLLNPGTFPMERLLAIFQCITSIGEGSLDEEEEGYDGLGIRNGNGGLMSDVLLQLSSLCSANFIVTGGSCPLEGSTRYRSTVSEDMVLKMGIAPLKELDKKNVFSTLAI
ncbi:hypothetical protein GBA52_022803 [Prunus armeniaca]|nr:hypothetical protein GBA52_022803 [Prunus armeniaca]